MSPDMERSWLVLTQELLRDANLDSPVLRTPCVRCVRHDRLGVRIAVSCDRA